MGTLASAAGLAAIALATLGRSEAAELKIYAAGAVKSAVSAVAGPLELNAGARPVFTFGTVGALRDRILAGERAEVAILSAAGIEALRKGGKSIAESAPLGSVSVALAVPKGAKVPAIDTEAELRTALLAAPSIAYADPAHGATAGMHFVKVLERLGIADAVKAKALVLPFGIEVIEAVGQGKAALGVSQSSEIAPHPGVTLAGPLPGALALRTAYIVAAIEDTPAARAAVRFLSGAPEAQAAFAHAGFERVAR